MTTWFWLLLAVLLFWSVGAYNRLVRLRAQVRATFQAVDRTHGRFVALVQESLPEPRHAEWTAQRHGMQAAAVQFDAVLNVARRDVMSAIAVAALHEARAALEVCQTRLREAAGDDLPAGTWSEPWLEASRQADEAAAAFNDASQAYNDAIRQFPALVLARLFGFQVVGRM